MNYAIHIKDVDFLEDELILHHAERKSILFKNRGGKEKDEVFVPTELDFTLETNDGQDAKYKQYFTSKEKQFRVDKIVDETGELVSRTYLLPESFQEPYENPLFYPGFSSLDGLGLLKGKYLTEDFFSEEKSVTDVIAACLELTEIDFDIYLSPAYHNVAKPNWKDIYLDTKYWGAEKYKPTAYQMLYSIVSSMRCQLFQCEGRWYIEGYNKRQMLKATFYIYTIGGSYKGTTEITKTIKKLKHFVNGATITMVPAVGRLTINKPLEPVTFPKTIYQDDENDWIVAPGVKGDIYPQDWTFNQDFQPLMEDPNHYLHLRETNTGVFQEYLNISLRKKRYLLRNSKVTIKIGAEVAVFNGNGWGEEVASGDFHDLLVYKILLNGRSLYFNLNTTSLDPARMNYDEQGKASVEISFVTLESGFLDIILYQPHRYSMRLLNLSIDTKNVAQRDQLQTVIDEDSSITKTIDLDIADDITANTLCWQLEKLREYDTSDSILIRIPVLDTFHLNGLYYSVVSVKGAQLIEQFPDRTKQNYIYLVNDLKVIYNFNGGSEMVVKHSNEFDADFWVYVMNYKQPKTNREDWSKWSDSVYGGEALPVEEVIANIEKRMYQTPHYRVVGGWDFPAKYNDIIQFEYDGEDRYFAFSDLSSDDDEGIISFTMNECLYEGLSVGNIPPYVSAGPDIQLPDGETSVQVTQAIASDPDGQMESTTWTQISGPTTATFSDSNSLNPLIGNLVPGEYIFELTGVDDGGNAASDQMTVYSVIEHLAQINAYDSETGNNQSLLYKNQYHRLNWTPNIPDGLPMLITFDFRCVFEDFKQDELFVMGVYILKNGNEVYRFIGTPNNDQGINEFTSTTSIQYLHGDNVEIVLSYEYLKSTHGKATGRLDITDAKFLEETNRTVQLAGAIAVITFDQ